VAFRIFAITILGRLSVGVAAITFVAHSSWPDLFVLDAFGGVDPFSARALAFFRLYLDRKRTVAVAHMDLREPVFLAKRILRDGAHRPGRVHIRTNHVTPAARDIWPDLQPEFVDDPGPARLIAQVP